MWDDVYAWALAQAAGLAGVERVYDGQPRQEPSEKKYAVVGGEDPAGTYEQAAEDIDTLTAESGEVVIKVVSRSGEEDLSPHRVTTKAWVDSLAATVNADMTLGGILRAGSTAYVRADVRQVTAGGAYVERVITVTYGTRV